MPSLSDWMQTPLALINTLFEEAVSKPDYKLENHVEEVKQFFSTRLSSHTEVAKVPSLNDAPLHTLSPTCLVRYRCMVQDMFDPEYYLGVYEVEDVKLGKKFMQSGMFKDLAECKAHQNVLYDSDNNKTLDRQTLYCVPVPGENSWTKQAFAAQTKVTSSSPGAVNSHTKRSREDDEVDHQTTESRPQTGSVTMENEEEHMEEEVKGDGEGHVTNKKAKTEGGGGASKGSVGVKATGVDLNFPLEGEKGPACLVKLYGSDSGLKVNDMVEFIGVLSGDPAMAEFPDNREQSSFVDPVTMEMDSTEQEAHYPPPSLVPRLHVILATRLTHSNPLLPMEINEPVVEHNKDVHGLLEQSHDLRGQLIDVLQRALYGDTLAAEYVLCHLISTVYSRRDVLALGQFSVNLCGCPRDSPFPTHLGQLIGRLVAKSHYLPLTVDNLNNGKYSPQKDYKANRLTSGQLQLSDHTQLILDETAMQPGQLNADGIHNLAALGNVITWQKVEYDFVYHKQDFPTNVNVLVCSEGRSLVKCDCKVTLAPRQQVEDLEGNFRDIYAQLTEDSLCKLRTYLGLIQQLPYSLSEELQKEVENDFVSVRKEDPEKMTIDDFHKLLVLARLVCISHGQMSMNKQMWEKTKLLELQRKQRLQNTAQSA